MSTLSSNEKYSRLLTSIILHVIERDKNVEKSLSTYSYVYSYVYMILDVYVWIGGHRNGNLLLDQT